MRQERLLPGDEIDSLWEVVPKEIVCNQERFATTSPSSAGRNFRAE
jgi:hypothetical protein